MLSDTRVQSVENAKMEDRAEAIKAWRFLQALILCCFLSCSSSCSKSCLVSRQYYCHWQLMISHRILLKLVSGEAFRFQIFYGKQQIILNRSHFPAHLGTPDDYFRYLCAKCCLLSLPCRILIVSSVGPNGTSRRRMAGSLTTTSHLQFAP